MAFVATHCLNAQEIDYYSDRGAKAESHNCDYYTIGKKIGEKYVDTVRSYYCQTNSTKSITYYLNGLPEGKSQHYFRNGKLEKIELRKNGRPVGVSTLFYPTGVKRAIFEYDSDDSKFDWSYRIVDTWDSLGQSAVKNGNGFCNSLETIWGIEVGFVKNGLKDSTWVTFEKISKQKILEETYKEGELLKGKRLDGSKEIEYRFTVVAASPKKGMKDFYNEIGANVKYPKAARRAGIKGKVFVQFTVYPDGTIQDVKCIKGIGGGCDEAAIEAVSKSKPWMPGTQKGIPVKQRMTLPIEFNL